MSELSLRLEGALEWLELAAEDLRAARHSSAGEFHRNALFLCQQCTEKAIKGFLTFNNTAFPKSHSISALADLVEPLDPDLCLILQAAQVIQEPLTNPTQKRQTRRSGLPILC